MGSIGNRQEVENSNMMTRRESTPISFGKEPSASEYAELISDYNRKASSDGYKVSHTNLGFIGDYVTTPSGEKYTIIETKSWPSEYSIYTGNRGYSSEQPTKETFKSSKEALEWLKNNEKQSQERVANQERVAQSLMSKYESAPVGTKRTISALRDAARTTKTTASGIETTLAKAATKGGAFNADFNNAVTRTRLTNILNKVAPNTYEFRQVTRPSNNKMMKQVVEWRLFKK